MAKDKETGAASIEGKHLIKGFELADPVKLEMAINGTMTRGGELKGGVGQDASEDDIIAEYDRLGGLIKKGKYTVKIGSFYDFKGKAPHKKSQVGFIFRNLEGDVVEIKDGEEVPLEVVAAEKIQENKRRAVKKEDADEDDE